MGRVAGIVLAAGTATRLGGPKQLLRLAGRPVLSFAVEAARRGSLDPIVVVLGAAAEEIERQVDLDGTRVVRNPDYATGLSSSVRAGVRALPPDVDAAVFVLGDQPEIEHVVIERIVREFRATGAAIVQPKYAEGRGNPVLVAREFFPALFDLTGDEGARPLLHRQADRVRLVDVSGYPRPEDIDTREDYERVRARFEPSALGG